MEVGWQWVSSAWGGGLGAETTEGGTPLAEEEAEDLVGDSSIGERHRALQSGRGPPGH